MKIYNRLVIDINGQVVEEDSFEYDGPVALAKGGGGASGAVDYPPYQKQIQADWLAGGDYDDVGSLTALSAGNNITALLNQSIGNSPYAGLAAYSPDARIADMEATVDGILTQIQAQLTDFEADITTLTDAYEAATEIDTYSDDTSLDELEAYIDSLSTTDQVEAELAAFDESQDNIGAIGSSAWVIGRTIIASGKIEAKLQAETVLAKLKDAKARVIGLANTDKGKTVLDAQVGAKKFVLQVMAESINKISGLDLEVQKIAIIALKEEMDKNIKMENQDALWDLNVFAIGANVMASIAGGTVSQGIDTPSDAQSAIAGGLSGGAAGAMLGGTAAGAALGLTAATGGLAGLALGAGAAFL